MSEEKVSRPTAEIRAANRLHMVPEERLILGVLMAGGYGLMHGLIRGAKRSSLAYLAENAHRLPRTRGTWYFFHKRKNYVVMKQGMNLGAKVGLKFASVTGLFLYSEAYIDELRGKIDLLGTVGASTITGLAVVAVNRLPLRQAARSILGFMLFGGVVGGIQDLIRAGRNLKDAETPLEN